MNGDAKAALSRGFTPDRTRELLADVCERIGLDPSGAILLRHQTNAVYQLSTAPVVVKIARPDYSVKQVQQTVALTRWLTRMGTPTLPLLDCDQPVIVSCSAATLWPYLTQTRSIETDDIAGPLKALHALPSSPVFLPPIDPVAAICYSLKTQRILTPGEHDVLAARCDRLAEQLNAVRFESTPRIIHGDPQHGNTLWDRDHAVLCDWDSAAIGNPEWDLITIEVHSRRFDHSEDSYRRFCEIYGRDIREWSGYPVLRDLRELRMISTNARKSLPASRGAEEVRRRILQLSRDEPEARWSIL